MNRRGVKSQAKRFIVRRIAKAFGPTVSCAEIADETGLDRHFVAKVMREMRLPHRDGRGLHDSDNLKLAYVMPVDAMLRRSIFQD